MDIAGVRTGGLPIKSSFMLEIRSCSCKITAVGLDHSKPWTRMCWCRAKLAEPISLAPNCFLLLPKAGYQPFTPDAASLVSFSFLLQFQKEKSLYISTSSRAVPCQVSSSESILIFLTDEQLSATCDGERGKEWCNYTLPRISLRFCFDTD